MTPGARTIARHLAIIMGIVIFFPTRVRGRTRSCFGPSPLPVR